MTQHQSKQTAILTFSEMGGNKSKEETSPKKCCFNTAGHYNWHYFTHMFLRPWKQVQQWNQFSDLSQLQQSKIRTSPWRCWLWGISTQCGRQVEDEVTGLLSNGTQTNREFIKQEQINEVCSLARHQEWVFFTRRLCDKTDGGVAQKQQVIIAKWQNWKIEREYVFQKNHMTFLKMTHVYSENVKM